MSEHSEIKIDDAFCLRVDDEKVYVSFEGKSVERKHQGHKSIKNIKRFALVTLIACAADACDRLEGLMAMQWLNAKKPEKGGTDGASSKPTKGQGSANIFKSFWSNVKARGYTEELVHALAKVKSLKDWSEDNVETLQKQLDIHHNEYQTRITKKIKETWTALGKKKAIWNSAIKECKITDPKKATIGQWHAVLLFLLAKQKEIQK